MKKALLILLMATTMTGMSIGASAQQRVVPAQCPTITMAGDYNSTTIAGGSHVNNTGTINWLGSTQNVLYTKKDTINNTGTDTLKSKLMGEYNSVYTWCHVSSISGTNTSCTLTLYATGAASYLTDPVQVYSVTVSAANPAGVYLFNNGTGWPYTNWFWVFTGVGTHSSSLYSGCTIR